MRDADQVRSATRFAIGLLCVAAFVLILIIVSGSDLDETSGKAIETAVALAFLSLTAVAGSHLALRQPRLALFGHLTALISALAFLLTASAIWAGSDDSLWETAAYALILAFACGHSSVLMAGADESDSSEVEAVRGGTIVALWLLAVLAAGAIASSGSDDIPPQAIGVVAVLYALGTIVLPLIRRAAPRPASRGELQLDHLVIAVSDRSRSDHFYTGVLGAVVENGPDGRVAYRIGNQRLNVHQPGIAASPLAVDPVRPGNSDLCFVWPGSAESAVTHLLARGIEIVEGPVARTGAGGPGVSVYCRDPDGSLIELISYDS
jgi:catechol 2,3-dioxygenase-like lactoylglutathione lyase family enzyme